MKLASATNTPMERWREDPFAPLSSGKKAPVRDKPRLVVPPPGRLFPPTPKPIEQVSEKLIPQPPRRVAGILFSDRVNALMQTPDGWETVQPGQKLRDGTVVERIERDRVVLRTADERPRQVVVKLAASPTPLAQEGLPGEVTGSTPGALPSLPGLPPGIPPGGRRAM